MTVYNNKEVDNEEVKDEVQLLEADLISECLKFAKNVTLLTIDSSSIPQFHSLSPSQIESYEVRSLKFSDDPCVKHQVLLFIQLSQGNAPAVQKMSRRSTERAGTGKEILYPLHKSQITQVTASKARQGRLMSPGTPALYR
ncbi:hypothetical protein TNCV_2375041 [Trichonephila clavipes]|nr:hypothetical protein TNCV_2375041 [Trichonephila clavipes]